MKRRLLQFLACSILAGGCERPAPGDAHSPGALVITGRDFAYDAPDTILAGPVRLTFHNTGPSYHHIQIARVVRHVPVPTAADSLPATGELPAWLIPVGGAEGADSIWRPVTVSLTLTPGQYLLLCRITTPDGRLHSRLGMVRPLVVLPAAQDFARVIPADTTVILQDYSVSGPDSLAAGVWRLRVKNQGPHEHNFVVARLGAGYSLQDVLNAPPGATPVFEVYAGTAGLAPGEENVLELELRPGSYVLLCLVVDRATGKEHYALGMVRLLTVT